MSLLLKIQKLTLRILGKEQRKFPAEATEEDIQCINHCLPFTMTSLERIYATLQSTKYIVKNNIKGAFVECGVWRGGNSMVMCKALITSGVNDRDIYLFDTFLGMTDPTDIDCDAAGTSARSQLMITPKSQGKNIWCIASLEDVKSNILTTNYPIHRVHYIKGDVLDTLNMQENLPESIALLRLDTDWYESTKKELQVLFPRLVKGGVCLVDDYGHWQGSRKAVDEYLSEHGIFPLMHVTDYTGRAFIKI